MKKILTLLITLCCAYMMYPQQQTDYHYEILATRTVMDGKGSKAKILNNVYDVIDDGEQLFATNYQSNGYDNNGGNTRDDYVRVRIIDADGFVRYVDYIQLSDSREQEALRLGLIDGQSNGSSSEQSKICLDQLAALKRARRMAKRYEIKRDILKPQISALDGANQTIIINNNCYPCNEGESESYVGTQQSGFDNFDVGTYGSPPQNSFPQNDFQNHFDNDSKEKTFFGTYVVPALIGFGIASIGFMAWDGFSDGEWFDFNGTKPRQIIRQVPFPSPGGGAGPAPNGMIFSF